MVNATIKKLSDDLIVLKSRIMTENTATKQTEVSLQELDIYKCYESAKYLSVKHSSYFQVYEELFSKYRGKKITFVEIGVLNGGSLFMWRNYFGSESRIIGVEFNPAAKKWEEDGFEIYIGSQSDPQFWDRFFSSVGEVDVILDDGGHTNEQQIITTNSCIPHIKDGGVLVIEDVHTSYFRSFGNPSKYSFINYSKTLIDSVNSRFPSVKASKNVLNNAVFSLSFYESIVCFNIDRAKCFTPVLLSNGGITSDAKNFWDQGNISFKVNSFISRQFKMVGIKFSALHLLIYFEIRWVNRTLKKFFT